MEQTIREDLAPTAAEKAAASSADAGVEYVDLGAPILADTDRIVAVLDPIADGALTVAAQPDVPRNLTGLLTDANNSVSAVITIVGKDIAGNVITEVMTIVAGQAATKSWVGTKLFATVTSATVSGTSGAAAGDTIQLGVGNVIALPKPISNTTQVKHTWVNAVPVTPDAIAVGDGLSGVDANGATYDGSKIMRVAYKPGLF